MTDMSPNRYEKEFEGVNDVFELQVRLSRLATTVPRV